MKKTIKVGSDFSEVGAFDYAMQRVAKEKSFVIDTVYACDWDKYARLSYVAAHTEPKYYPKDVYEREIPKESLDIYMTSPPCQAFSLAGKRLGKEDKRGILFFNSLEFIQVNKPRFFIFENVKGLLSDDGGKTFQEWVNLLGGKSVNGLPVLFPYEDSVPYHLYWKVLNAKEHGVPQNRERVFLIGIRDDADNNFQFPKEEHLSKRLKDVLEREVLKKFNLSEEAINKCLKSQANKNLLIQEVSDVSKCIVAGYYKIPFDGQYIKVESNLDKYFLSEKALQHLSIHKEKHDEKGTGFGVELKDENSVASTLQANGALCPTDNHLKIKSGTWRTHKDGQGFREIEDGNCPTIPARAREDVSGQPVIKIQIEPCIGSFRGRNPDNPSDRSKGCPTKQTLEINKNGTSNTITSVQKDNLVIQLNPSKESNGQQPYQQNRIFDTDGISPEILANLGGDRNHNIAVEFNNKRLNETLQKNELPNGECRIIDTYNQTIHEDCPTLKKHHAENGDRKLWDGYKIRRLTPLECFRLMDFPDTHVEKCKEANVSDSQLYKQAGNSIVVRVLEKILDKLPL